MSRHAIVTLILALTLCPAGFAPTDALANPVEWTSGPGRQIALGNSQLTLGGYASAKYWDTEKNPWQAKLSDLSLFLHWDNFHNWQIFSEIEIEGPLRLDKSGLSAEDGEFGLERLYVDYWRSDQANLRFGKFLTPIGYWNQVHANPLTWTVTRPLTTEAGFAHHATGLMVFGNIPASRGSWSYQLYLDDSKSLDPKSSHLSPTDMEISGLEAVAFEQGAGARLIYLTENTSLQLGASLAAFKLDNFEDEKLLGGLDFLWRPSRSELSGEFVYRSDDGNENEFGGFLQAVLHMKTQWYAVSRLEYFNGLNIKSTARIGSLAVVWRNDHGQAVKLERRFGKDSEQLAPDGLFASVGILF